MVIFLVDNPRVCKDNKNILSWGYKTAEMSRKISIHATCWHSIRYERPRFAAQNVAFRRAICALLKGDLPPFENWEIVILLTTACRDARLVRPP